MLWSLLNILKFDFISLCTCKMHVVLEFFEDRIVVKISNLFFRKQTYELQKYRTRINALQISSAWERKYVMWIDIGKGFVYAWLQYEYDTFAQDKTPGSATPWLWTEHHEDLVSFVNPPRHPRVKLGILQHKPRSFGSHAWQVDAGCSVMQFSKGSRIINPSPYPVYSIISFKMRWETPLMGRRITNAPALADLHDNSGVRMFLHRISWLETSTTWRTKSKCPSRRACKRRRMQCKGIVL